MGARALKPYGSAPLVVGMPTGEHQGAVAQARLCRLPRRVRRPSLLLLQDFALEFRRTGHCRQDTLKLQLAPDAHVSEAFGLRIIGHDEEVEACTVPEHHGQNRRLLRAHALDSDCGRLSAVESTWGPVMRVTLGARHEGHELRSAAPLIVAKYGPLVRASLHRRLSFFEQWLCVCQASQGHLHAPSQQRFFCHCAGTISMSHQQSRSLCSFDSPGPWRS